MRRKTHIIYICLLSMILNNCSVPEGSIEPVDLTCEYSVNPPGVESQNPRLSWKLISGERNQVQSAFQIIVASSEEILAQNKGDLWNSGQVNTSRSIHNRYEGSRLQSGERYYWKVRIWDKNSQMSDWSAPASWEMGLINAEDWEAEWIGYECRRAPLFRKDFSLAKKISRATVNICGLGYYELRINGEKVSDHILDPGQTDYEIRSYYVVHNVTELIKPGGNTIGVELGNGFYNQKEVSGGFGWEDVVYGEPKFILQLQFRFEDGTDTLLLSDKSWKAMAGPTYNNNVYVGDFYDARLEQRGWDEPGFDDSAWGKVQVVEGPGGKLMSQKLPPVKKMKIIKPVGMFNPETGVYVYDMGQNFAGWAKLKLRAESGTEIQLRFSEELFANKMINMSSCGGYATGVEQSDKYICKGGVEEIWEPKFTYHGFRYVEMIGFPGTPSLDNLEGVVVYTSARKTGDFTCSDTMINKIHKTALWTATSNIHSVITDCPHREKCGWLGDIIAEMLIYNLDVPLLLTKFERDIETSRKGTKPVVSDDGLPGNVTHDNIYDGIPWDIAPGRRTGGHRPDWGSTFIHLPWYMYLYYGDISLALEHWEGMMYFMDHLNGLAKDYIIYEGYGDMFSPGSIWSVETPVALTSTAIYYFNAKVMSSMAAELGKSDEASYYHRLSAQIKRSFIKKFYHPLDKSFGSQTANAMALEFGLVPEGDEKEVASNIAVDVIGNHNGHFSTGHMGSRYLYGALADYNYGQVALDVLTQTTYPGIGNLFARGATTFWESWGEKEIDENSAGVRSRNHPFQAGYDAWFYSGVGGIKPDPTAPGFRRTIMDPQLVGDLTFVKASYQSLYGDIISNWCIKGDDFHWSVTIPVNTAASVYIRSGDVKRIFESGIPVVLVNDINISELDNGKTVLEIGSGNYYFEVHNYFQE